ncbi:hypothetical protein [Streptomyces platensis]|uniref:hypothetical protein n=1 Tax=Streptomyces platensis TaxID=58346 RepID=UPI002E809575|nr:hypothetical protein [Streptomyces platensis]WUB83807.1 hypothetical protein OG424_34200 [Streptomyces platensis]
MTTLIGVFAGSVVSRRAQDRSWNRDQQVAACLRVLQESSTALTGLSEMEASRPASAAQGMILLTTVDWDPWNEALSLINVVADRDIADVAFNAAHLARLDEASAIDLGFPHEFLARNRSAMFGDLKIETR